ncbi:MAG: hypothetical protein NUW01_01295 [Gemmatimonadaceae bacterium]|nr:hypothetical protein [Gemmatimonadaceae bacterium]
MAPTTERPKPFDVKLKGITRDELGQWLCDEITAAEEARGHLPEEIQYWWRLYEQARTRLASNQPWPDAADLTSYLGAEKVDALHARMLRTIFTEPVWVVEGWGEAAKRAPVAEEFHQWALEDERLQSYIDKALLNCLIEPAGILEVMEDTATRRVRKTILAALELADNGMGMQAPVFGEDNQPKFAVGADGKYQEVDGADEQTPSAKVEIDSPEPMRIGPAYRVIPYVDFLTMPAHARDKREVWGFAKRFWRRVPELEETAKRGIYDKAAVELVGKENERETTPAMQYAGLQVPTQDGPTAQKELFEVLFLRDLDGQGERWYVATVHRPSRAMLRLQADDLGEARYIRFVPYPRPDSIDGYSFVGHKLITVIEEHTAWRNLIADRAALVAQAPIKILQGALYNPQEQPWGPRASIYVRDMNEVQAFDMPDLPASVIERERDIKDAAERVAGISDIALGTEPQGNRTLGERQMVAGYSEVRMDAVIKRIQESMEELGNVRNSIWKRALAEQEQGMELPAQVQSSIEARGVDVPTLADGRITAAMLDGRLRFKPRGSVETADLNRQRQDFTQWIAAMAALSKSNPLIGAAMGTPQMAETLMEQAARLHRIPDRQSLVQGVRQAAAAQAQMAQQQAMQQQQQMAMGGAPPMPGGPAPGGAPMGGPPMDAAAIPPEVAA